jgi:hypothetical protein
MKVTISKSRSNLLIVRNASRSSEEVSDHTKAKKLSRFDIGSILYANLQSKLRSLTK